MQLKTGLLVLVVFVSFVVSWGPATHQFWGCLTMNGTVDTIPTYPKCFQSSNSTWRSYILGASAPDAFKKLSPTMHSLKFALVQYKLALKQPKTADFDPVAYSLGYGSHLAEDYVGHYKNGYITPEYDHYIEFAADTNFFFNYLYGDFWFFPFVHFNDNSKQFAFEANQQFAQFDTTYKAFSQDDINKAAKDFDWLLTEESSLISVNLLYKDEMIKYDFCKATTYEQARDHLTVSQTLITNATSYWFFELSYDADPLLIDKEVVQYVDKLFDLRNGTIC